MRLRIGLRFSRSNLASNGMSFLSWNLKCYSIQYQASGYKVSMYPTHVSSRLAALPFLIATIADVSSWIVNESQVIYFSECLGSAITVKFPTMNRVFWLLKDDLLFKKQNVSPRVLCTDVTVLTQCYFLFFVRC